jgi:putative ABC transport system permease protein
MLRLFQELKYGLRGLRKSPAFAVVAVVTLALGIGANTAVYSIVNALILHPYPFPQLDQLVLLRAGGANVVSEVKIAPADFLDLQRDESIFKGLAAYRDKESNLTGAGEAEPAVTCEVTPNFFDVLGEKPAIGRTFSREEVEAGRNDSVIVNHGFWLRRLGGDRSLLGKSIEIDGQKKTVVGIMPAGFNYPPAVDFWMPLPITAAMKTERSAQALQGPSFQVLGRLRPNLSLGQAQAQIESFAARLRRQFPDTHQGRSLSLLRLREEQYVFSAPLFLTLQIAALFVLLLASANLINLFLARLIQKQRELAVRTALGASKARLAELFLAETLPLALFAGAIALGSSMFAVNLIRDSIPFDYTKWAAGWESIRLDWRVIAFGTILTVIVGVLFALGGAMRSTAVDLNQVLKEAGGRSGGGGRNGLRGLLAMAQVVFATVLLAGAGLMAQGFFRMVNIYKTLDPANVLTAGVRLPPSAYPDAAKIRSFYQQFVQRAAALPGVEAAGLATNPPASNVDNPRTLFVIEGQTVLRQSEAPSADLQSVSPDFFQSLKIPVLQGRNVSEQDGPESTSVAVISRAMAARFWPGQSPIGRRVKIGEPAAAAPWTSVIGIVDDVKQNWWDGRPRPVIYLSYLQAPKRDMDFTVRARSGTAALAAEVRAVARTLDPSVSFVGLGSMDGAVSDSLAPLRILGILMVVLAAVALALAALGIYGVLAHSVAQRRHEFGVRLALGAQRQDVLRLVLSYSWKLAAIGLGVGLPLAFTLSLAMRSVMFGVVTFNALVFIALASLVSAVALLAAYVPARRAMHSDPMLALRSE